MLSGPAPSVPLVVHDVKEEAQLQHGMSEGY
jgi:hypothetical protein